MTVYARFPFLLLLVTATGCVYHSESVVHRTHMPIGHVAESACQSNPCCMNTHYPGASLWNDHGGCGTTGGTSTVHRTATHSLNLNLGLGCRTSCGHSSSGCASRGCHLQRPTSCDDCCNGGCQAHAPAAAAQTYSPDEHTPPAPMESEETVMIDSPGNQLSLDSTRRSSPMQQVAPKRHDAPADIVLNPIPVVKSRPLSETRDGEEINPAETNPVSTSGDGEEEVPENDLPTLQLSL